MLSPGDVIDGKYRVVCRLGVGGMGAVFEGHNIRLNRRVAIKVMLPGMSKQRNLITRFEREAQAAANIGSIHVVDVFDLGDLPNGARYMVMEFLEGESLQARLQARSRLSPRAIADIAIPLLEGLARVHQAGIVHRDLKPANIFLARGEGGADLVKILDFGVCKFTEKDRGKSEASTGVGAVLGTLGYMSPEQLEHGSKNLDGRADLYAVGVLLYRAVTGTLPYGASTVIDLLRELREGRAPQIGELARDVDRGFAAIVHRALEWDRTARYATAREFQRALVDWREGDRRIHDALTDFLTPPVAPPERDEEPPSSPVGRISLLSKRAPASQAKNPEPPPAGMPRRETLKMEKAPPQPGRGTPPRGRR